MGDGGQRCGLCFGVSALGWLSVAGSDSPVHWRRDGKCPSCVHWHYGGRWLRGCVLRCPHFPRPRFGPSGPGSCGVRRQGWLWCAWFILGGGVLFTPAPHAPCEFSEW